MTPGITELIFSDASGTVTPDRLVGATLLRTILDIDIDASYYGVSGPASFDYDNFVAHFGLAVVKDNAPSTTLYNPNTPYGDFMIREHAAHDLSFWNDAAGTPHLVLDTQYQARSVHIDTNIKRRFSENSRLFISWWFSWQGYSQLPFGYTGRVLIQLP